MCWLGILLWTSIAILALTRIGMLRQPAATPFVVRDEASGEPTDSQDKP